MGVLNRIRPGRLALKKAVFSVLVSKLKMGLINKG